MKPAVASVDVHMIEHLDTAETVSFDFNSSAAGVIPADTAGFQDVLSYAVRMFKSAVSVIIGKSFVFPER